MGWIMPKVLGSKCIQDTVSVVMYTAHPKIETTLMYFLFACVRDLLLPDGNRVSAFSVASTAIAAAQWSSSQVGSLFNCHPTTT